MTTGLSILARQQRGVLSPAYLPMPAEYVERSPVNTAISGENFHRSLPLQHMCFRLANESLCLTLQALFKLLFSFFSLCVSGWVRQQVSHLEGKSKILTTLWTTSLGWIP